MYFRLFTRMAFRLGTRQFYGQNRIARMCQTGLLILRSVEPLTVELPRQGQPTRALKLRISFKRSAERHSERILPAHRPVQRSQQEESPGF